MAYDSLKLGIIGGLGLMASPMARHWKCSEFAKVLRVHDRGTKDERRDRCRAAWCDHGAELVPTISEVVTGADVDGVIICAGKNGDDLPVVSEVAKLLAESDLNGFICHLSTVSTGFAVAAEKYCRELGVTYVNYPLTGGPSGAESAKMLVLASGDRALYERLEPALQQIGVPRYFGERVSAGAEVKLIGHLMVFSGMTGIASAIAVHTECFQNGVLGGEEQTAFFDFLNSGAGGTKQWDLFARVGIAENRWDAPFYISYAAVDAIYAAKLCIERGVSLLVIEPVINICLAYSYVLNEVGEGFATQAVVREMIQQRASGLDAFLKRHWGPRGDAERCLANCIESLPKKYRSQVQLDLRAADFNS
jgi:3-hydroxyisobutyrate dehydrogenase